MLRREIIIEEVGVRLAVRPPPHGPVLLLAASLRAETRHARSGDFGSRKV